MDPVSVFNALYDTRCLKFGQYDLKSGLVAPYYINLRKLPLYPKLMDAVVTQVVERFLSHDALVAASSQLRARRPSVDSTSEQRGNKAAQIVDEAEAKQQHDNSNVDAESDADSHLDADDATSSSNEDSSEDSNEKWCDSLDLILCGVPWGAVPLASAIAYKAQLPYLFERKGEKTYGDTQPLMDGFDADTRAAVHDAGCDAARTQQRQRASSSERTNKLADQTRTAGKQQRVVLIEDVICSGESILDAVRALEQRGLKVEFVICLVDREENGTHLLLKEAGIRVATLYSMSAILRILEATGRISSEQYVQTRAWMAQNQFESIGVDPTPVDQQTTAAIKSCKQQQQQQQNKQATVAATNTTSAAAIRLAAS